MLWNDLNLPDKDIYFYDNDVVIYCCDCREILPELPKVDLVLTDPPYGVGIDDNFNDDFSMVDALNLIEGNYAMCVFTSPRRIVELANKLKQVYLRTLCWYKPNDIAHNWHGFFLHSESIVIFKYGKYTFPKPNYFYHDVLSCVNSESKYHPAQKPIEVLSKLINNFSSTDNLIIDCFAGSGSTLLASKKLNRHCIGIEIEEKYCEIAVNRLRQQVMNLDC